MAETSRWPGRGKKNAHEYKQQKLVFCGQDQVKKRRKKKKKGTKKGKVVASFVVISGTTRAS